MEWRGLGCDPPHVRHKLYKYYECSQLILQVKFELCLPLPFQLRSFFLKVFLDNLIFFFRISLCVFSANSENNRQTLLFYPRPCAETVARNSPHPRNRTHGKRGKSNSLSNSCTVYGLWSSCQILHFEFHTLPSAIQFSRLSVMENRFVTFPDFNLLQYQLQ